MEQVIQGYCTLCRSRCGSLNHVENGVLISVSPDASHPTGGALCAKGRSAPEHIRSPLRLTKPLTRISPRGTEHPQWCEISWEEALDTIAGRLLETRARLGAEAVAFAVTTPSGTPMVDSYEWVERFIRYYGSPNLIYAVEVCGWHKDYAHALTFGRGIGVPDLEHADTIILWGHNPARTWLAQASRIASAHQRGATLVVIDPKIDGSGQQADLWMNVRPGADAALAMGAIRHLLATNRFDHEFVYQWTNAPCLVDSVTGELLSVEDLGMSGETPLVFSVTEERPVPCPSTPDTISDIQLRAEGYFWDAKGKRRAFSSVLVMLERAAAEYDVDHVAHLTWIDAEKIIRFNELFQDSPRLAYHSWTGVGQHSNASQTERAIATLYALSGACDRKGGNLWTVSPPWRAVNQYEAILAPEQRKKALGLEELPLGPPRLGWVTTRDFSRAVLQQQPYAVTDLISFGTNLLVSQAETVRNKQALESLAFHVHVDMYMNPTAENADIVLPASMPWEREALRCGFEISQAAVEHIQLRAKMLPAYGECRSDMEIVFQLAERLGMKEEFFGAEIDGAWNYQLAPLGITVTDLRAHPAGLRFPQPFKHEKYRDLDEFGRPKGFGTPSGKVELYSQALLRIGQPPLASFVEPAGSPFSSTADSQFPMVLSTAKSGWFVHTSHRHVASLRRKSAAPQVQISSAFASKRGIVEGHWVQVKTPVGHVFLQVTLASELHENVAIADFGWWQGCEPLGLSSLQDIDSGSSNTNAILSDKDRDPISGSVPLRAVPCSVMAAPALNRGRWAGQRPFTLVSASMESVDVARLSFAPVNALTLPDFIAGQHISVQLADDTLKRHYSLIGPNKNPQTLEIGVRLARAKDHPDGLMSTRMHQLQVGETVLLSEPSGHFTLPSASTRPVILVGSGIGITPFVGYLEALKLSDTKPPAVVLINICRNSAYHPFATRLAELAAELPCVQIITVYWDALPQDKLGMDYNYAAGPDYLWLTDALIAQRPLAYLCGSTQFLTDAKQGLKERGVFTFDIFDETFSVETRMPKNLTAQIIHIEGEAQAFSWTPDAGTILDAADRAGQSLPSGCRVGQCESCSVQLLSGKVVHLSPYDGPPDRCLTCRAVPLTPLSLKR
jgi:anaerobic selenocysteine-containing dehydrogenase/ferredoxin-NADP reductase